MKITTLIENLVYKPGLQAEHGLALLIDTGDRKVLLDTGQSPAFISNAKEMGIDLADIDSVVISHGHYDHTGGLNAFLMENAKAKVYLKRNALTAKYHGRNRFIGMDSPLEQLNKRAIFVDSVLDLGNGIFLNPTIPIENPIDTSFGGFQIRIDDRFDRDEFNDELFISIVSNDEVSILSSCSHRGISNVVKAAMDYHSLPINLIMGGFHLKDTNENQMRAVVECMEEAEPKRIGVCHCTGVDNYVKLKRTLDCDVFYSFTGSEVVI